MPGDDVEMTIELILPIAMEEKLRFAIREGGRTVGSGVVAQDHRVDGARMGRAGASSSAALGQQDIQGHTTGAAPQSQGPRPCCAVRQESEKTKRKTQVAAVTRHKKFKSD